MLELDCVQIAYWTFGSGKPLVLITGLATPAASWGPLPRMLADHGYKVVVIDNRDAGRSSRCDGIEYSMRDMADDVAAVLDAQGIGSAYVLGISMGGMIAQELALSHPRKVEKLLLMSTDPGGQHRLVDDAFWTEFLSMGAGDPAEYMTKVITAITAPGFAEANAETVRWMVQARTQEMVDLAAFQRHFNAILGHGTADRLRSLQIPVLVMHGESDRMVKFENGPLLAGLIPEAELITIPGAGHLLPIEATSEVISAITRFFPADQEASV